MLKNFKKRNCQGTHVQNHAYANKGRGTDVSDVRQLANPAHLVDTPYVLRDFTDLPLIFHAKSELP